MVNEERGAAPGNGETPPAGEQPGAVAPGGPRRAPEVVVADQRPALAAEREAAVEAPFYQRETSRRRALRGGFFSALGLSLLGSLGLTAKFIWPMNVKGFGGTFVITPDKIPEPGADPVKIVEAKAWIVNLQPDEGVSGEFGIPNPNGGILALWQKCPHLGCSVPWLGRFDYRRRQGWFRCPCHQSTYTKAGIRVFGPAPRPMDTFEISFDSQGRLVINTGKITLGGEDNATRAIQA